MMQPTTTSDTKANSSSNSNVPPTTSNRQISRKRKLAPLLDTKFLEALLVLSPTTTPRNNISPQQQQHLQLTSGAVQALHDCQEAFVGQLTCHLRQLTQSNTTCTTTTTTAAADTNSRSKRMGGRGTNAADSDEDDNGNDTTTRRRVHVMPRHVEEAMRAMGLHDIFQKALQDLQSQEKPDDIGAAAEESKGIIAKHANQEQQSSNPHDRNQIHSRLSAGTTTKNKKKRKPNKKFSAEMEAEQERLLQASASRQKR